MAHEIKKHDGLVLYREPAWHGLGIVLQDAPTPSEALELAGLDWTVSKRPLWYESVSAEWRGGRDLAEEEANFGVKSILQQSSRYSLVRDDIELELGSAGRDYVPFQNSELAELVDALARDGVIPKVETGGSVKNGARVFFTTHVGDYTLGASDAVKRYVLFSAGHDGVTGVNVIPTDVRVVCANTLGAAEGPGNGLRFRHDSTLAERIKGAKSALARAGIEFDRMQARAARLASVKVDEDDVRDFFRNVYQRVWSVDPIALAVAAQSKDATAADVRRAERAKSILSQWIANLSSPRNTGVGTEGTVWHALNAVTEWTDHQRDGATSKGRENLSAVFGSGASIKRDALEVAVAVAQ